MLSATHLFSLARSLLTSQKWIIEFGMRRMSWNEFRWTNKRSAINEWMKLKLKKQEPETRDDSTEIKLYAFGKFRIWFHLVSISKYGTNDAIVMEMDCHIQIGNYHLKQSKFSVCIVQPYFHFARILNKNKNMLFVVVCVERLLLRYFGHVTEQFTENRTWMTVERTRSIRCWWIAKWSGTPMTVGANTFQW